MGETGMDERQYVILTLGAEVFGLDINKVKEIIVYQDTTKMPGTSHLIEGIINLRGHVIPVFSLQKKFGFAEEEKTNKTRIVVVEAHKNTVGIIVDSVSEVLMIPDDVIEKPSSLITSDVDENYIKGIANTEDKLIILLDLEKIIDYKVAEAV